MAINNSYYSIKKIVFIYQKLAISWIMSRFCKYAKNTLPSHTFLKAFAKAGIG